MYAKPELVKQYVSHGGHTYRPDLRRAIFGWINLQLKQDQRPVTDTEWQPIEAKRLRVFPEEVDLPGDAINSVADETFVVRAAVTLPEAGGFSAWKKQLLAALRASSFKSFLAPVPPAQPTLLVEGYMSG